MKTILLILTLLIIGILIHFNTPNYHIIVLPDKLIEVAYPIIITNSNTKIIGGNHTILRLKNNANCPVIIIGGLRGNQITNVIISNITIDGNRTNQSTEYWIYTIRGVINNNGILVQNAKNVNISNIIIKSCKSGGLVTTLGVNGIIVDNIVSYDNEYDGIACYETSNGIFSNLKLYNNKAAGISLDNNFNSNTFNNCFISNNVTGIFMRTSSYNQFNNIVITNGKYGVFIAQVDKNTNTACINNIFDTISIKTAHDFIINDVSCTNNTVKNKWFY